MAAAVLSPVFYPYGNDGPRHFLSGASAPPSVAGDGTFVVGDTIINTTPTAGGTYCWICTTAGTGATATFKTVAIGA